MNTVRNAILQLFFVLIMGSLSIVWAASDNFGNATMLTGTSGQISDSNTNATKEAGEPDHGGGSGGASIWWKWTAPSDMAIAFDTHGSSFDTLLAVYTGSSVSSLTMIDQNDDDDSTGYNSSIFFEAQAGTAGCSVRHRLMLQNRTESILSKRILLIISYLRRHSLMPP